MGQDVLRLSEALPALSMSPCPRHWPEHPWLLPSVPRSCPTSVWTQAQHLTSFISLNVNCQALRGFHLLGSGGQIHHDCPFCLIPNTRGDSKAWQRWSGVDQMFGSSGSPILVGIGIPQKGLFKQILWAPTPWLLIQWILGGSETTLGEPLFGSKFQNLSKVWLPPWTHLLHFLLAQPALDMPDTFLPQGLGVYYSHCLEGPSPVTCIIHSLTLWRSLLKCHSVDEACPCPLPEITTSQHLLSPFAVLFFSVVRIPA